MIQSPTKPKKLIDILSQLDLQFTLLQSIASSWVKEENEKPVIKVPNLKLNEDEQDKIKEKIAQVRELEKYLKETYSTEFSNGDSHGAGFISKNLMAR